MIELLNDDIDYIRETAARSLAKIGDERAIQPLIELLKDDSTHFREVAARTTREKLEANELLNL